MYNYIADPRTDSYISEETGEVVTSRDQWQVNLRKTVPVRKVLHSMKSWN